MCECGCGEMRPIVKLPAPGGKWYMVEIYPGCRNCQNDFMAVAVYLVEEGDDFGTIEDTPAAEFHHDMWGAHILDHGVLQKAFMESRGDNDDLSDANFSLSEFLREGGLITAFYQTEQKERDDAKARAESI